MNKSIEIQYCESECVIRGFCRIARSIQHQSTRGGTDGRDLIPLEPKNLRNYVSKELEAAQTTCLQPRRVIESVENVYSQDDMPREVEEKLNHLKQQISISIIQEDLLSG